MYGSVVNKHGKGGDWTTELASDLVWNLQTWPLDLVEWPTHNSHRMVSTECSSARVLLSYRCRIQVESYK